MLTIAGLPTSHAKTFTDMIATLAPIVAGVAVSQKSVWRCWIKLYGQGPVAGRVPRTRTQDRVASRDFSAEPLGDFAGIHGNTRLPLLRGQVRGRRSGSGAADGGDSRRWRLEYVTSVRRTPATRTASRRPSFRKAQIVVGPRPVSAHARCTVTASGLTSVVSRPVILGGFVAIVVTRPLSRRFRRGVVRGFLRRLRLAASGEEHRSSVRKPPLGSSRGTGSKGSPPR